MTDADLPGVVAIERESYEFPWSEQIFRDCLVVGYVARLCMLNHQPAGHGIMSVAAGECHVMNLCIRPAWRGRGYGSALLLDLLEVARARHATMAFLEVRRTNGRAHELYRRLGFNEVGIRRRYYPARIGREDAIVLARVL